MRTAVRDWFAATLTVSAEQLGEDLRAEVEKQGGWPQPPIRAHRRYWAAPAPSDPGSSR